MKPLQDYDSVPGLGLTGGVRSDTITEQLHFNKITISVNTLHSLRIREAIPSPNAWVLCKHEGR